MRRFGSRNAPHAGALAFTLLLLVLVGCATNPVTGERELSFMSPERERALGAQEAEKVAQQIGIVNDPDLTLFIDAIGQRLAANAAVTLAEGGVAPTDEYHFAIADMPEPNAFALPGGWIYVSRGLLALANSEAEVANVVGHEIGHVLARHSAQRYTRQVVTGVGSAVATIGAGVLLGGEAGQVMGQLSQAVGAGLIASYGRDQERQSDQVGQALAAHTGYDPAAMADFFRALEREELRLTGSKRLPSWLDSHPVTSERIDASTRRAAGLAVRRNPALDPDPAAFLARLEGLLVGPNAAEGVFQEQRFLHPTLDFRLDFPSGWDLVNQKTLVAGVAPEQDALVILQGQEEDDPRAAARAFAEANRITLQDGESLTIGGFGAYRAYAIATAEGGQRVGVHLTWIAHPKLTFRIMGQTLAERWDAYRPQFQAVGESLRALTDTERASIQELRLHIVKTRSGETIEALSRRTGNAWSVAETADANAVAQGVRLPGGRSFKIVREVPVQP